MWCLHQVPQGARAADDSVPVVPEGIGTAAWLWLSRLPPEMHHKVVEMLRSAKRRLGKPSFGSAFSGTELTLKLLRMLDDLLDQEHCLKFDWQHSFCAEKNPAKRAFIRSQHDAPVVFCDAADLAKMYAMNEVTGEDVVVPFCTAMAAGFSCKSRSRQNNNRAKFKHCISKDTDCETTATFKMLLAYVRVMLPLLLWVENVGDLMQADEFDVSDYDYVLKAFTDLGYFTQGFAMEATTHGSIAKRSRLYIVAVLLVPGMERFHEQLSAFSSTFLKSSEIGAGNPGEFLNLSKDSCVTSERPQKTQRVDFKYLEEHNEFFRAIDVKWPPSLVAYPHVCTTGMFERHVEVAIFLDCCYPRDPTIEGPEFIDANHSLGRIMGRSAHDCTKEDFKKSVWTSQVPTITSMSSILMRWIPPDAKPDVMLRLLTGVELMSVIGWSQVMWAPNTSAEMLADNSTLTSLAGNAFSGYSIGPMLLLGIMLTGASPDMFQPVLAARTAVSDGEDNSGDSTTSPEFTSPEF